MQSGRENLLAMLRGQNPERLPLFIDLTDPVADKLEARTGSRDPVEGLGSDLVVLHPDFDEDPEAWREAYSRLGFRLPPKHRILRMGITMGYPEHQGEAYHLGEILHPLAEVETVGELEALPWADASDPRHYAGLPQKVAGLQARGLGVIANLTCTVFEDSWYLRGMDNLFADLMEEEEVGEWLLENMTQRSEHVARAYAAAGVDILWLGDDIGMQNGMLMSPGFWRTHLKPRLQRVIDAAREAATGELYLMYHSDGNIEPVIGDLFDMGIDILNPVQPESMSVQTVLNRFRDRGAFFGMIGTQSTLPNGTAADVAAAVEELRCLAEKGIRLICAPSHVIEPDVPWENLMALVKAPKALRSI